LVGRAGNGSPDRDAITVRSTVAGRGRNEATLDDRLLVERARDGDHDAFALLVRASVARLDGAARLIVRDRELAQDAVQNALVRAWRDLSGLRDVERFDPWLHRLTVNSCLDLLRRRKRRVIEVDLGSLDVAGPEQIAAQLADRDALDAALRRLDGDWRAIVVMRYYLDMPLSEIADALGIPLGTAKSRLHRALAAMRVSMTDGDEALSPQGRIA
jgi:RNA polymerase sigma-70 factor (ECF subfamily)